MFPVTANNEACMHSFITYLSVNTLNHQYCDITVETPLPCYILSQNFYGGKFSAHWAIYLPFLFENKG